MKHCVWGAVTLCALAVGWKSNDAWEGRTRPPMASQGYVSAALPRRPAPKELDRWYMLDFKTLRMKVLPYRIVPLPVTSRGGGYLLGP